MGLSAGICLLSHVSATELITVYVGVSEPNLGSAVGFFKWANLENGDFETRAGRFKAS
ncbi:hypothetical protein [Levilactobacillus sp. N40-8-2]|uniref:hypothetical protein n=1 Tax=Levilactobacillus muriae TaxID=3238987 RepID=UPI0038B3622C